MQIYKIVIDKEAEVEITGSDGYIATCFDALTGRKCMSTWGETERLAFSDLLDMMQLDLDCV